MAESKASDDSPTKMVQPSDKSFPWGALTSALGFMAIGFLVLALYTFWTVGNQRRALMLSEDENRVLRDKVRHMGGEMLQLRSMHTQKITELRNRDKQMAIMEQERKMKELEVLHRKAEEAKAIQERKTMLARLTKQFPKETDLATSGEWLEIRLPAKQMWADGALSVDGESVLNTVARALKGELNGKRVEIVGEIAKGEGDWETAALRSASAAAYLEGTGKVTPGSLSSRGIVTPEGEGSFLFRIRLAPEGS